MLSLAAALSLFQRLLSFLQPSSLSHCFIRRHHPGLLRQQPHPRAAATARWIDRGREGGGVEGGGRDGAHSLAAHPSCSRENSIIQKSTIPFEGGRAKTWLLFFPPLPPLPLSHDTKILPEIFLVRRPTLSLSRLFECQIITISPRGHVLFSSHSVILARSKVPSRSLSLNDVVFGCA